MASLAASSNPDGPGAHAHTDAAGNPQGDGEAQIGAASANAPQVSPPPQSTLQNGRTLSRDPRPGSPQRSGPRDPEPLLVGVHGWLLSGRLWSPLAKALAPRRTLWCLDLPGFGQRPRPRGLQSSLASYGRWLAEAVRERADGRPVVLISHSLGGSIALHSAAHLGEQLQGLVQIAAGGGIYQPRPFAVLRRVGAGVVRWRPAWLASLPGTETIRSPLQAESRAAQGLLACSTNRGAVRQLPLLTSQLTVPSLWICGSRDRVMEPRYVRHLAGFTPLHRLELLEGAGHLPMQQCPAELAQLIETWLQEQLHSGWALQSQLARDPAGRAGDAGTDPVPLPGEGLLEGRISDDSQGPGQD